MFRGGLSPPRYHPARYPALVVGISALRALIICCFSPQRNPTPCPASGGVLLMRCASRQEGGGSRYAGHKLPCCLPLVGMAHRSAVRGRRSLRATPAPIRSLGRPVAGHTSARGTSCPNNRATPSICPSARAQLVCPQRALFLLRLSSGYTSVARVPRIDCRRIRFSGRWGAGSPPVPPFHTPVCCARAYGY